MKIRKIILISGVCILYAIYIVHLIILCLFNIKLIIVDDNTNIIFDANNVVVNNVNIIENENNVNNNDNNPVNDLNTNENRIREK